LLVRRQRAYERCGMSATTNLTLRRPLSPVRASGAFLVEQSDIPPDMTLSAWRRMLDGERPPKRRRWLARLA
jgi:hypothetical protein